ncbi:uncharacterized protein TNCV_1675651 [Trichonephila clavipes]|nr:uncharacterized protein TNCV_1675651 [Trichonephila clavipes]
MYIHTLQDALFIGYKQSFVNARLIAFSQRTSSTHLIEGDCQYDSDIINNLIIYEDEREEPDTLRAVKLYAEFELSNKPEKNFLNIDTNFERNLKFQKELRSCISSYHNVHKQLTTDRRHKNLSPYFKVCDIPPSGEHLFDYQRGLEV